MKSLIITLVIVSVALTVGTIIGLDRQEVPTAPAPVVESSPEQTQPGKIVIPKQEEPSTVSENKNETTQIPVTNPASENVKSDRRTKGKNKHMDTFGMMGFIFGITGLVNGLKAIRQVSELKKEVEKLKSQVGPKS